MIGAIIQARMGSSRLPGKVLRQVAGKSLLAHLVERLQASTRLQRIVVATTTHTQDDPIEAHSRELGVFCERGSEDDVLDRYYQAAQSHQLRHIVRITADCPLIDPHVVDRVIERYQTLSPHIDYVSNVRPPTYPDGLDVEVFSWEFLEKLQNLSDKTYQREHVCTYMVEHPEQFRCENVANDRDLSQQRWTVDNREDFELVRRVFEALYPQKKLFLMQDILDLLERHPEWAGLNQHLTRNAGFVNSLAKEGLSAEQQKKIAQTVLERRV